MHDGHDVITARHKDLAWALHDHIGADVWERLAGHSFRAYGEYAPVLEGTVTLRPHHPGTSGRRPMTIQLTYLEDLDQVDVLIFHYVDGTYQGHVVSYGVAAEVVGEWLASLAPSSALFPEG